LKFKFLLLFIFYTTGAQGFDKDFKTVNDRVPLEFSYLFDSMKIAVKRPSEKINLVGLCKELDENLGQLQKEQIFFLMKSEVIKNILEYKFDKVRSFDMTTYLIKRLENDLKEKQKYLTPFAQWIWRAILAELNNRKDAGLITDKSFEVSHFSGAKKEEAMRFERYLNYLLPWVDKMDSLSASQFNDLAKEVSWLILHRLNSRSLLFKRFSSTATTDAKITIFNIPDKLLRLHPEEIKKMQRDEAPLTLKEESEKEKSEAARQVQDVTADDLSPLSEEVSKELDQKAP
jgi:hypothetical protein